MSAPWYMPNCYFNLPLECVPCPESGDDVIDSGLEPPIKKRKLDNENEEKIFTLKLQKPQSMKSRILKNGKKKVRKVRKRKTNKNTYVVNKGVMTQKEFLDLAQDLVIHSNFERIVCKPLLNKSSNKNNRKQNACWKGQCESMINVLDSKEENQELCILFDVVITVMNSNYWQRDAVPDKEDEKADVSDDDSEDPSDWTLPGKLDKSEFVALTPNFKLFYSNGKRLTKISTRPKKFTKWFCDPGSVGWQGGRNMCVIVNSKTLCCNVAVNVFIKGSLQWPEALSVEDWKQKMLK